MRTSTIFAILFFVALAIVTVFLVLCQMDNSPPGSDVKSEFLNDMQPYLNDTITTDVITNVYIDNPTIINTVYNTSRLRNLFNNILSYNKCVYNSILPPHGGIGPAPISSGPECGEAPGDSATSFEKTVMRFVFLAFANTLQRHN